MELRRAILSQKILFLGQIPISYIMEKYSPITKALNKLIQRSVEHGFVQFYERLETFYKQLKSETDEQFVSQAITMDNIWIYVYIFVGANGFSCVVFLCENLYFHRKKLLNAINVMLSGIGVVFLECRKPIGSGWRILLSSSRSAIRAARNMRFRRN